MNNQDDAPGVSAGPSYCWVRIVPLKQDTRRAPVIYFHGDIKGLTLHGWRPPGVVHGQAYTTSSSSATMVWSAHPGVFGREGAETGFEYGPAFDNEREAVEWLTTADGEAWDKEALNRFLMVGTVVTGALTRPLEEACIGDFKEEDWREEFRYKHKQKVNHGLFDHCKLKLKPPADYVIGLDERAELKRLSALRPLHRHQIYAEAHSGVDAVRPVLEAAGWIADGQPMTRRMLQIKQLRQLLLDAVQLSVFKLKFDHCRARPWSVHPDLPCLFSDRNHRYYPGHPSFPSGHATVAHVFARFIASVDPSQDLGTLQDVARQVALRREIAGVHFRSDSLAGEDLAKQIAEQLVAFVKSNARHPLLSAVTGITGRADLG